MYPFFIYFSSFILTLNIVAFLIYGLDKWKATHNAWRIPEPVLLCIAFLLCAPGAASGMLVFHHKVSKPLFRALIPLALFLNLAFFLFVFTY